MDVEDGRHYKNRLNDATLPEDWEARLRQAVTKAEATLESDAAAMPRRGSIYTGISGVAYALLQLVRCGLSKDPRSTCLAALGRLREAEGLIDRRRATMLEGRAGCIALQAWAHHLLGDSASVRDCVERLGNLANIAKELPSSECEVLYGRCGYLGSVLFVRQRLENHELLAATAAEIVAQVVSEGRRASGGGWPLYFEWHDKCYLGGAHGIAGILLTLLQLPAELALAGADATKLVHDSVEKLLLHSFSSGNLPSSLGNSKDRLVQFCHGATGLVPLLLRMGSREGHFLNSACKSGEAIWLRGLLCEKGLGLCHGIPGNGYSLLAIYRATGQDIWLRRAIHFGLFAAEHEEELLPLADRPHSLFEGLAGAMCFWTELIYVACDDAGRQSGVKPYFPCYEFGG
eukprot:TRINITY_DN86397_c0_g1_i1.p1 TRINITY_DN86397_c0_g1~~TRINITY_DN86397_c0_g1_i1.p1  ORF type:complete len:403 (+),score=63.61 TRINITY_DN86397_c0_g1_i1:41-1249(+)